MRRSWVIIAAGVAGVVAIVALIVWPLHRPALAPVLPLGPTPGASATSVPTIASAPVAVDAPTLRFVNVGDWGNSRSIHPEVFRQLERTHASWRFTDIVTNGDNNYGAVETFPTFLQRELGRLQAAGVELHFSLGNHDLDDSAKLAQQVSNPAWGEWDCGECLRPRPPASDNRYYSFYRAPVRFVVLDSNRLLEGDADQPVWAVREVVASNLAGEPWQVLVFHHPPFSAAQTHGGSRALVEQYKGVLKRLGVDVVFSGHDHTYERIATTPECGDGVQYVVNGAVKLRRDDIKQPNACTASYGDDAPLFVAVEATPSRIHARAITETGQVVDEWELTQPD